MSKIKSTLDMKENIPVGLKSHHTVTKTPPLARGWVRETAQTEDSDTGAQVERGVEQGLLLSEE